MKDKLLKWADGARARLPGAPKLLQGPVAKRGLKAATILSALVVLFYYPVGMLVTHEISDDLKFVPLKEMVTKGGSKAVDIAAALIERETRVNSWVANDPFFMPAAALDNMPNFQQGIRSAIARFAFELTDQIGRTRGSSQTDKQLQAAAGQLQYPGDVWVFHFATSVLPTTTSEARYQEAKKALLAYNKRLAAGSAVFERRADNLLATLDRIALDLGASSAVIEKHIDTHGGGYFDFLADDVFYGVKGQVYAYYLILNALGHDFEKVIREREIKAAWGQMMDSMQRTAAMSPAVVSNADPDGSWAPSHLAAQGFYLLRARTKLREITNILLK